MTESKYKSFLYPPGGILIWIIILLEVITFTAGISAFIWQRSLSLDAFEAAQNHLHVAIGFSNTLVLLTSGFFIAEGVRYLKSGHSNRSRQFIQVAILLGCVFLALKGYEYYDKLQHGLDLSHSIFFTYYWLLTGFHFVHVLVGLVLLIGLSIKIKQGHYHREETLDVETGAAFWHMCDIIWLLLFPVLYLL